MCRFSSFCRPFAPVPLLFLLYPAPQQERDSAQGWLSEGLTPGFCKAPKDNLICDTSIKLSYPDIRQWKLFDLLMRCKVLLSTGLGSHMCSPIISSNSSGGSVSIQRFLVRSWVQHEGNRFEVTVDFLFDQVSKCAWNYKEIEIRVSKRTCSRALESSLLSLRARRQLKNIPISAHIIFHYKNTCPHMIWQWRIHRLVQLCVFSPGLSNMSLKKFLLHLDETIETS